MTTPEPSSALPILPPSTCPHILSKTVLASAQYQGLATLTYTDPRDPTNTPRTRDYIFLRDRDPSRPVGTLVPNIYLDATSNRWCTVLVRQFRPQYEADTIEFPGGFISRRHAETGEEAAARELEEETSKRVVEVLASSPDLTSEPVPIAARLRGVLVRVEEKEGGEKGRQRLDKGEFAVEVVVPLDELEGRLEGWDGEGVLVDPRVWMFCMGMRVAAEVRGERGRVGVV